MKKIVSYIFILIIIAIFGLITLNSIVLPLIVNANKSIYLPDCRNIDYRIGKQKLDSLGFISNIIFKDFNDNQIPFTIIETSPKPFTKLKSGRIIKLIVAGDKKDIILDSFIDKSIRNTFLELNRMTIAIDTLIYEYNNDIPKDYIISQYPKAGKLIKSGDEIVFIVSQGKAPNYYMTPNLINMNLPRAKETISKAGLLIGNIEYEFNTKYLNNTVLEQSKTSGMKLSFPAKIDLIVSKDK
jgi:beta-lactam-binding protein with PASTA domain